MTITPPPPVISAWHDLVASPSPEALRELLAPQVTFRSPAVHTQQEGAEATFAYLWAAVHVLRPTIEYQHEWYDKSSAVLQFSATINGFEVSGVDIIKWNADNRISEFTVMARPLKGLQALINAMGAELQHQQEARS